MKSVISVQAARCLIQLQHEICSNSALTRRELEITSTVVSSTELVAEHSDTERSKNG